ncbi:MAG: hypothetical protein ACYSYL_20285 [Planctomycetota bacterium]|jgi:hypothetical protein
MPRLRGRTTSGRAKPRRTERKDTPGTAADLTADQCRSKIEAFRKERTERRKWSDADQRLWNNLNSRLRELRELEAEVERRRASLDDLNVAGEGNAGQQSSEQ